MVEVRKAEITLQQTRADLAAEVRKYYFAWLTATEAERIFTDVATTAERLATRQQKLLESGQGVAAYEVAQAKVLAANAKGELLQAQNRQLSARKQLATLIGLHDLSELLSGGEIPVPKYSLAVLETRLLDGHTELQMAEALVTKEQHLLALARAKAKPDIGTNTYVQHDFSTKTAQVGLQLGVVLPVYDANQGAILQAQANLGRASHEAERVRLDLKKRLAEAFERYDTNSRQLEQYRTLIVPEQLKAFEGLSKRFEQEPGKVSFSEVVLAQQTLSNTYSSYLTALSAVWQAVADISRLVQTEDIYRGLSQTVPMKNVEK